MNIGILHLSDIHMALKKNAIISKYDKIHSAIQEHIFELDQLYITVTGDSAYSGKNEEYIQVSEMLERIFANIKKIKELEVFYIIIPGNHDCDFGLGKPKIRNLIIQNIHASNTEIDEEIINELVAVQEENIRFLEIFNSKDKKKFGDRLFESYLFQLGEYSIIFNCLNSAWISTFKEDNGSLFYPIDNYKEQMAVMKADLVISTIHHPQNWFTPENGRSIREVLEKYSDIILTGHEHISTASKREDFDGNSTQYIEGGVLQESKNDEKSQFNLIIFNLSNKLQKIARYSWNSTFYTNIYETDWLTFNRSQSLDKSDFIISEEFKGYLNDPGITIKHPRKAKVVLEDIYIYPDARIVKINNKSENVEDIINLQIQTSHKVDFNYFVLGSEKSGKTTFCKSIFSHHYNHGLTPVYINGLYIKVYMLT